MFIFILNIIHIYPKQHPYLFQIASIIIPNTIQLNSKQHPHLCKITDLIVLYRFVLAGYKCNYLVDTRVYTEFIFCLTLHICILVIDILLVRCYCEVVINIERIFKLADSYNVLSVVDNDYERAIVCILICPVTSFTCPVVLSQYSWPAL